MVAMTIVMMSIVAASLLGAMFFIGRSRTPGLRARSHARGSGGDAGWVGDGGGTDCGASDGGCGGDGGGGGD